MAETLKVVIDADVDEAIRGLKKFEKELSGLATGSIKQLEKAALILKTQLANLSPAALKSDFGKQLSGALQVVNDRLKTLKVEAGLAGGAAENAFSKAFQGARTLANIIPGIGIGGLIGLAATAVNELTQGFFEAAFGASKLDKALDEASGSIDKEAGSIITMVKALQSGTLSSSEFKKVKAELIAQAPEFQKTFDGDKISIEASDLALTKYIAKLTNTVKVTAALSIVNDTLAKSIATIAKGGDVNVGKGFLSILKNLGNTAGFSIDIGNQIADSLTKAEDALKSENISKLIDDTFKKLGISFKDFAGTIDSDALKKKLEAIKKEFEKFQAETIAKAKLFNKEFGSVFVVPDLDEHFFTKPGEIFKKALKELEDIKTGSLKIKIPKVEFELLPDNIVPLTDAQLQELTKGFFEGIRLEKENPLTVTFDPTISPEGKAILDKKLNLKDQFKILGEIGNKEFDKIFKNIAATDFSGLNEGIARATKELRNMMEVANTLNQAIGGGLVNAFNSVFDAILEGKSVFKALGEAIKSLVVGTIKAIAQMLILKAVTSLIFPGGGSAVGKLVGGGLSGGLGGTANFGGIGSSGFNNVMQIVGAVNISGQDLNIVLSRAQSSNGRF